MYSPEDQSRISDMRAKALAGTLTLDEARQAILMLRAGRETAAAAAKASGSKGAKAKAPARNADDMLNELEGL